MKSTVLSWRFKLATQSVCRRAAGSLFQACGPATENAPRCTKCNNPPINGQCINFTLFDVAPLHPKGIIGLGLFIKIRRTPITHDNGVVSKYDYSLLACRSCAVLSWMEVSELQKWMIVRVTGRQSVWFRRWRRIETECLDERGRTDSRSLSWQRNLISIDHTTLWVVLLCRKDVQVRISGAA